MSRAFPILASAGIATQLPEAPAVELWISWKKLAFEFLVEKIKEVDARFPNDPRERKERLRALRREHHLVYIVDRLRRRLEEGAQATATDLTQAAQYILDRNLYPVDQGAPFATQAIENRRALVAARVNWHKLMRQAGARPPGREGGWSEPDRQFRGSAKLFRALDEPGINQGRREELLRAYIERRLEQLVAVSREIASRNRRDFNRRTRLMLEELELSLKRARKGSS
jgi:hypothetical protein